MDFTLSEEHRMIQQSIRKFCRAELDPIAGEIDRGERFPVEVYRRLSGNGFVTRSSESFEGKSKIPDFERGRQGQNGPKRSSSLR